MWKGLSTMWKMVSRCTGKVLGTGFTAGPKQGREVARGSRVTGPAGQGSVECDEERRESGAMFGV